MQTILLDQSQIAQYKLDLAKQLPEIKSSHRAEALAAGFGFGTYASLGAALTHAPSKEFAAEFSESKFFDRLKAFQYEGVEQKNPAIQKVFSLRSHIERKNRFGSHAIADLVAAAGYTAKQHDFLEAALLFQVIAENGGVNKSSIADVAKRMSFSGSFSEHADEIVEGLSIGGFDDANGSLTMRVTAERTIAACWDLGAASTKKVLSSTSPAVVPSFRHIKFDVDHDALEFSLHPSALAFLRSRHRLHHDKNTSTGLSPRDKEAIANISSISVDAIADLKNIAKAMGLNVDQLAEAFPRVKVAIENTDAIIKKTSERLDRENGVGARGVSGSPDTKSMH